MALQDSAPHYSLIPKTPNGYVLRGLLILTFITLATHGLALFDGKVLDDFWHQKGLREHGWTPSELMRTLMIAPRDFLHTWWQTQPVVWHYFRPFFILCMKFVFTILGRGDPMSLHAFSLALHFVSGLLVWRLCWLLTANPTWSLIGGILFIIYPHSAITVAWPSSQNVVLQTTLLLATILAYVRASGLRLSPGCTTQSNDAATVPTLDGRRLAWAFALWLLAVFTRENAILLPLFLAAMDASFGGWRHLWARRGVYAVMVTISVAFYFWREWMHIPPLPEVYCRRPDGDWSEYGPWLAAKFLHYLCASIWIAPMTIGPTGRYNPWSEAPGDCVLMLAIVAALGLVYWRATRAACGWWVWPLWILLSILPVTAVVATPHSGYMCGVGFAVAAALGPAMATRHEARAVRRLAIGTTLLLTLGAAFMTPVNRLQWVGIYSAERYLPSWVMVSPPDRRVREVFFINLPFVNIYCKPNLVDRLGAWFEKVNVHVLTWAPLPLKMDQPSYLEQIDARSFIVSTKGRPYFSGLLGRFVLEAFRGKKRFHAGQEFDCGTFRVRILDADEQGVSKLRFTFPRPLTDPDYCFYFTSAECGALPVRFKSKAASEDARGTTRHGPQEIAGEVELETLCGRLRAGYVDAGDALLTAVGGDGPFAERAARQLREVAYPIAVALGAPEQALLAQPRLSAEEWNAVDRWWRSRVTAEVMGTFWHHRRDFDDLIYMRYEVDFDRFVASHLIRTDLYLTGPPFPGPR